MNLEQIFENNQEWLQEKLKADKDYFKKLAEGQQPGLLYIGCSDSRVTAESLMGLEPGEMFVHRNVANVVTSTDVNMLSVVNYAVNHLKVRHVVICGHYGCGGVKAAMGSADLGIINPWVQNIRDVYRLHQAELDAISVEDKRYNRLIELNVQEQCVNLMKNPDVQRAHRSGQVLVHGWIFDIGTGKLIDLKVDIDKIMADIMPIYKIQ